MSCRIRRTLEAVVLVGCYTYVLSMKIFHGMSWRYRHILTHWNKRQKNVFQHVCLILTRCIQWIEQNLYVIWFNSAAVKVKSKIMTCTSLKLSSVCTLNLIVRSVVILAAVKIYYIPDETCWKYFKVTTQS